MKIVGFNVVASGIYYAIFEEVASLLAIWTTSLWMIPLFPLLGTPLSYWFAQFNLLVPFFIFYCCIR